MALSRRTSRAVIARRPLASGSAASVADAANDVLAAKLFQIISGVAGTVL